MEALGCQKSSRGQMLGDKEGKDLRFMGNSVTYPDTN